LQQQLKLVIPYLGVEMRRVPDSLLVILRAESSGDIGYDTRIYNENFPHHPAEVNYLMVIKRINVLEDCGACCCS
jgi:hypothetical protein